MYESKGLGLGGDSVQNCHLIVELLKTGTIGSDSNFHSMNRKRAGECRGGRKVDVAAKVLQTCRKR